MTAANSVQQSIGALSLTLAASATAADLADLDPARDILLELFAAAIIAELTPRWTAVTAGITGLAGTSPVQTKLPAMPEPEALQQVGTEFPLLTVARSKAPVAVDDFTLDRGRETRRWDVDYILGPLSLGNSLAIGEALVVVARVLHLTMRDCGHRAYAQQGDYPKNVLAAGAGCCNFSSSRVVDYEFGVAQLVGNGPKYHAVSMTLETTELSRLNELAFPPAGSYGGNNITLQTGTGLKTIVVADSAIPLP